MDFDQYDSYCLPFAGIVVRSRMRKGDPYHFVLAAARADGSSLVCGAFEAVYWTAEVAGDAKRELWLTGRAQ
jgi:hypothetical protein